MQVSSVSNKAHATFASAVGMSKRAATVFYDFSVSCTLCHLYIFEGSIEFVAQHRQVVVEFLARYLGINLCRDDVRMSQYTAHALNGHSL